MATPSTHPAGAVTMRTLARLAGTSVNTVSLALRDSPKLSTVTKKKIQDLAELHRYRMNPLVSAFASSRRRNLTAETVAVLTKFPEPILPHSGPLTRYSQELFAGVRARADELGLRLEEFATNLPDSPNGPRLTDILRARGIRGVMLFPSGDLAVDYPELDWRHFSVVAAGFHMRRMRVHRTAADHTLAMELCLEEAQARGYRRIGLAMNKALDPRLRYECSGRFLSWQQRQPKARQVPLVRTCSGKSFADLDDLRAWIARHRPDCIISHADYVPKDVRQICAERGEDVGLIHLSLPALVPSAGVDLRIMEVGRAAISLLARELYFNHCGLPAVPEVCLVGGAWHEGPHLRPRPEYPEALANPDGP